MFVRELEALEQRAGAPEIAGNQEVPTGGGHAACTLRIGRFGEQRSLLGELGRRIGRVSAMRVDGSGVERYGHRRIRAARRQGQVSGELLRLHHHGRQAPVDR